MHLFFVRNVFIYIDERFVGLADGNDRRRRRDSDSSASSSNSSNQDSTRFDDSIDNDDSSDSDSASETDTTTGVIDDTSAAIQGDDWLKTLFAEAKRFVKYNTHFVNNLKLSI